MELAVPGQGYEPYFFKVSVITAGKINPETGMSVDLVKLNSIAEKVLKFERLKSIGLKHTLRSKYQALKDALAKKSIVLRTVQFDECRGLSVLVDSGTVFTFRHDFATDDDGVLYQVTSQFDQQNKLTHIKTRNLKLNIEEQIIF